MIYRILCLLTIFSNSASGQSELHIKSNAFKYIDTVMAKDKITFEFLDFIFPQEVHDIVLRIQKAMLEKKDWSEEYFSKYYKEGEGLPYHENFGITKEEYQKIKDLDKTPSTIKVMTTATINTKRTNGTLTFNAKEEYAQIFNDLEVDLVNEFMIFNNDTIPYNSEINAPSRTPLGEWHGYAWKMETSNLSNNSNFKLKTLVGKIIEIDIGRVKQNNKPIIRLKYLDMNNGRANANLDLIGYIN